MPLEALLARDDIPPDARTALEAELAARAEAARAAVAADHRCLANAEALGGVAYRRDYVADRYTYISPGIEALTGYRPEEFTPQRWHEVVVGCQPTGLYAGLDREAAMALHREQATPVWTADYRLRAVDGSEHEVECSAGTRWDSQGRRICSVGLLRDVTEQRAAARRLAQAEAHHPRIFQNSGDALLLSDAATQRITDANPAAAALYGYSVEELVGMSIPELSADPQTTYDSVRARDRHVPIRRHRRRDGSIFRAEISATFVDVQGHPLCFAVIRDVTEQYVLEERLELAAAGADLGLWDWNLATGEMLYDERCAAMLGYGPSEVEPRFNAWERLIHPDDLPLALSAVQAHWAGQTKGYENEHRMRTRSGGWCWIHSRGRVVERDEHGAPLRMVGTHLDVTTLKQVEADRLELQRQALSNQKLESLRLLAGGIAHQFNNLLAGVIGNLELALCDAPRGTPLRECLEDAAATAEQAAQLSRQMRTYTGADRAEPRLLNLGDVVRAQATALRTLLSPAVSLEFHLAPDVPPVRADVQALGQMLANVVRNAAEALGASGGRITVSTGVRHCDDAYLARDVVGQVPSAGVYAWLEVADTGCGMDTETLERVFDPFYSTKFMGRGLGLPVVLGCARRHHGAILVDSEVGVGTTIRVLLPAQAG